MNQEHWQSRQIQLFGQLNHSRRTGVALVEHPRLQRPALRIAIPLEDLPDDLDELRSAEVLECQGEAYIQAHLNLPLMQLVFLICPSKSAQMCQAGGKTLSQVSVLLNRK